jgi:hypothetical protein
LYREIVDTDQSIEAEHFAAWDAELRADDPEVWARQAVDDCADVLASVEGHGARNAQQATFDRTVVSWAHRRAQTADAEIGRCDDEDQYAAAMFAADREIEAYEIERRELRAIIAATMRAAMFSEFAPAADTIEDADDLIERSDRSAPPPPASSFTLAIVTAPIVPAAPPRSGALV